MDLAFEKRIHINQNGWNSDRKLTPSEFYLEELEATSIIPKLVLVESFLGRRVSCNPLALVREGLSDSSLDDYHFVLVVTPSTEIPQEIKNHSRVWTVERGSLGYLCALARAEYLINNVTFPDYFVRREGQKYLNSWHGIPWKHLGRDIADGNFTHGNVVKNLLAATHLAFPDVHTAEVLIDRQGLSQLISKPVALTGSPRLDRTLRMNASERAKLRERLGFPLERSGVPVVLYAPTWREWADTLEDPAAEFRRVVERLSSEFPHALIAVRGHHFLEASVADLGQRSNVVVVPNAVDTNDLLAVVDVLVSDYSSIIFDFAATGRPILKLIEDLDRYRSERGLYFDETEVPGSSCRTLDELVASMRDVLIDAPAIEGGAFVAFEDGGASARVWRFLLDDFLEDERAWVAGHSDEPKVLFSVSGLNPNGITRSLQSLVKNLRREGVRPYVAVYPEVLRNPAIQDIVSDISANAELILTYNNAYRALTERVAFGIFSSAQNRIQLSHSPFLESSAQRDFRRQFTDVVFDSIVEFDGYNPSRTLLSGLGSKHSRKVHVFHNEFRREIAARFPRLRSALTVMSSFDVLASVSDAVQSENASLLSEWGVDPDGHQVLRNSLDLDRIRSMSEEPLRDDIRRWMDRDPASAVVIMMGRLSPEKNHAMTLEALAEANTRSGARVRLLIMGDGPLWLQMQAKIDELNLSDQVFLAGFDSNPYPALQASDAMLLPSLYEGQPIVLLESLTLGKPTFATDIPGSRSVLKGVQGGTVIPCNLDGIRKGLEQIGRGGLEASRFDADKYNQEVMNEITTLLLPA